MQMIEKPAILITSIGRTGTEFFARFFSDVIPDSTSLHEPDIVKFVGIDNKLKSFFGQVRRAGIWRMGILKGLGKWTLVKLSDARFQRKLNDQKAARDLYRQRMGFISRMPGSVYVESNLGYYGLLSVIPSVFANHRVIYIVRDGRDWIRSSYNWGVVHGEKGYIRKYIGHKWPIASDIPGDPLSGNWQNLSRFEQLCWSWARMNEFSLDGLSKNPSARLFYFEKIFTGENRYEYLNGLVAFATSIVSAESVRLDHTEGWLERKIHPSADGFPAWEGWTAEQKRSFNQICGPLMEKLGYFD